jgi:adenylate cyclase
MQRNTYSLGIQRLYTSYSIDGKKFPRRTTLQKTISVTVLFADIAKSTQLYDILGDTRAQTEISAWLKALSEVTVRHGGTVIKKIGDEVLCTFENVANAVAAGREMQQTLDRLPVHDAPQVGSPNIYVGIHCGKVIEEEGDIYGDVVNVAARLVALAKQRQVLLSEEAAKKLSANEADNIKLIDTEVVQGKFEEIRYYEYTWEQFDQTMIINQHLEKKTLKHRLELRSADHSKIVDQAHPVATFGRQGHNDFILHNERVSRTHARIEYRSGKFILIDQSSNGTFVFTLKEKKIFLQREEAILPPNGYLNFGEELGKDAPESIHFSHKV